MRPWSWAVLRARSRRGRPGTNRRPSVLVGSLAKGGGDYWPPDPPGPQEERVEKHDGQHLADADAPDQERVEAVDMPDQPAEVLSEEAHGEGQRQEDRGDQRQALGDLVEAVVAHRRVDLQRAGEAVALAVEHVGGAVQVVGDVAELVARLVALEA